MAERLSIIGLCLFSGSHGSYYCAIYLLGKCCCFANESLDTSSRAKPTSCQTPVKSNISNNVGPVKPFFEQTSPFTPRSGLVRFVDLCIDDHGSFVIFRSDTDISSIKTSTITSSNSVCRERDAPPSGRCSTSHHVRYRAVPRTNRTLTKANTTGSGCAIRHG
jgi:hypothetical protein